MCLLLLYVLLFCPHIQHVQWVVLTSRNILGIILSTDVFPLLTCILWTIVTNCLLWYSKSLSFS